MHKKRNIIKAALFICPFFLGLVGLFVVEKEPLLDAMYSSVQMYMLDFGGEKVNLLVELARWTAPLATASGILLAVTRMGTAIRNRMKYLKGNTVAVYGGGEGGKAMLAQLGKRGIPGTDGFVNAHSYILLGDEEENKAFYREHREKLEDRMVYMKCTSLRAQTAVDANIKLFSAEETAARLFWKQQALYRLSEEKDHRLNIVFIGFGKLGQELLSWGLQNLIFSPDQKIAYHIFGNGEAFTALHPCLGEVGDSVVFYDTPWYTDMERVEAADLVVVVEQAAQTALLADMLRVLHRDSIHVLGREDAGLQLLEDKERLHIFHWENAAQNVENILDESLLDRAKRINLRYAHLYSGVAESAENRELEWKKLNSFTRYSNISAADHHQVRLGMLASMGLDKTQTLADAQVLEWLSELEHMRWCRYHYLNNWKYGIPENGKAKDPKRRIHADLVPYEALTEPEKEKDRENIRVLLSVE